MPKTRSASTSTYDQSQGIPAHRINLASAKDLIRAKTGIVASTWLIRNLPVSKQSIGRTAYYDPRELLAAVQARIRAAPIIASGVPPAPRGRAIRSAGPKAKENAP